MAKSLHFVFGGDLVDPSKTDFKDLQNIHMVGVFEDYDEAYNAWKAEAQRTVDNAHTRYFISEILKVDKT